MRDGDDGEVDQVGEHGQAGRWWCSSTASAARAAAPPSRCRTRRCPCGRSSANACGNRPSLAAARDTSVVTSVHPFRAPMPETTASAATSLPAQAPWVKIVSNAEHERRGVVDQGVMRDQAHDRGGHRHVQDGAGRGAEQRGAADVAGAGSCTRLAVMAATSTPMKENRATPAAMPIALYRLPPEALNGAEVALGHEEPADHADEQQRQELQHHGEVLEPGHLPDAGQVDRPPGSTGRPGRCPSCRSPTGADAEQGVDVEAPRPPRWPRYRPRPESSSTSRSGSRRSRRTRAGRRRTGRRRSSAPAWSAGRTGTASSIAPTAMTASTMIELVPAPASTAGMAKTPVPTMLPTTRPVADVRPSARAFWWAQPHDLARRRSGGRRSLISGRKALSPAGGRDESPASALLRTLPFRVMRE